MQFNIIAIQKEKKDLFEWAQLIEERKLCQFKIHTTYTNK